MLGRAMLVDDERRDELEDIKKILESEGLRVDPAYEFVGKKGVELFKREVGELPGPPQVAIIDYKLHWKDQDNREYTGASVGDLLRGLWSSQPPFYILFVSRHLASHGDRYEELVDLLRVPFAGFVDLTGSDWKTEVRDQVRWGCDLVRAEAIRHNLAMFDEKREKEACSYLETVSPSNPQENSFIGRAPAFLRAIWLASRAAESGNPVLILGESGTGKELLAKTVHQGSRRKNTALVTVDCSSIADTLIEVELFGATKGSYTSSVEKRQGLFKTADEGTIFLDEIGELQMGSQMKLLRVLQEGEVRPVGADSVQRVDVRVICATNRDLEEMVRKGEFREDLYYRLSVLPIEMPPLRERREDIPELAEYFLRREAKGRRIDGFTGPAMNWLKWQQWEGNIRQLLNLIRRTITFHDGENPLITKAELQQAFNMGRKVEAEVEWMNFKDEVLPWEEMLKRFQLHYFRHAVNVCGSQGKAGERLGLSRNRVNQVLKGRV